MNFYIDPENINLNWFEKIPLVNDTFHAFFYLHFLPKKLKVEFLNRIYYKDQVVYKDILNLNMELCSDIKSSDFILTNPFNFYDPFEISFEKNKKNIQEAIQLNKKIILFYGDDDNNIPKNLHKNIILFTSSGFNSNSKNIFGLPTFSVDYFYEEYLNTDKLSISFCGVINNNIRKIIIKKLSKNKYSDFLIRNDWGGYTKDYYGKNYGKYFFTVPPSEKSKLQFIENIKNNLYGLCIRGAGNFSYRLGEVFMMGRIPILIDTDCILPFRDYISYEKNTVYVNHKDIDNIEKIIENYHHSRSKEELINIQKENRKIWLKYFTVKGAFSSTLKLIDRYQILN